MIPVPILDVITEEEESALVNRILSKSYLKQLKKSDRTMFRYGQSTIKGNILSNKIPDFLIDISNKLIEKEILPSIPISITVNVYNEGDFIRPHIDAISAGPIITILALESESEMILEFGTRKETIVFPQRSVLQIKDIYRTKWNHSIPEVKKRRISIVFRYDVL